MNNPQSIIQELRPSAYTLYPRPKPWGANSKLAHHDGQHDGHFKHKVVVEKGNGNDNVNKSFRKQTSWTSNSGSIYIINNSKNYIMTSI